MSIFHFFPFFPRSFFLYLASGGDNTFDEKSKSADMISAIFWIALIVSAWELAVFLLILSFLSFFSSHLLSL